MRKEIVEIVTQAAKAGAAEMLKALKPEADLISQREAYATFGIAFVKKHESGLTITRKGSAKNSKKYYSRAELVQLVASRTLARDIFMLEAVS